MMSRKIRTLTWCVSVLLVGSMALLARAQQAALAETIHHTAFPGLPPWKATVWFSFPQAFRGIARIDSRVSYLDRPRHTVPWVTKSARQ